MRLVASTARRGAFRQQRPDRRGGLDHLLDVVEEQEHAPVAHRHAQLLVERAVAHVDHPERVGDRHGDLRRVGHGREVDERDAAGEAVAQPVRGVQGEPALADAAQTGERHEPHVVVGEQVDDGLELAIAADQGCERGRQRPLEGYRRLTFMMLDADIVAVSPTSVWRVLGQAGLLSKWNGKPSKKGTGFEQPLAAHQHWHIDVSYINISGTFYYLCSILDGCSRYIVNWDLRESMTEADIEIILERAKELHPEARPRIISDNGPQFIAKDFKEFIRISGMTHVRTSPYYPQSNGKIERWHKSLKGECIRPGTPLSLDDARRLVEGYVEHYNNVRLNSAIGYITPKDMLAGRQQEIHAERDRKLEAARKQRQIRRQQAA